MIKSNYTNDRKLGIGGINMNQANLKILTDVLIKPINIGLNGSQQCGAGGCGGGAACGGNCGSGGGSGCGGG